MRQDEYYDEESDLLLPFVWETCAQTIDGRAKSALARSRSTTEEEEQKEIRPTKWLPLGVTSGGDPCVQERDFLSCGQVKVCFQWPQREDERSETISIPSTSKHNTTRHALPTVNDLEAGPRGCSSCTIRNKASRTTSIPAILRSSGR